MLSPILMTKLFLPTSRPNTVFRSLLIQRISEGIEQGGKLTLVSAPAGYGKTTLITEWLKTINRECAWVSMDAGDNDPKRFFTYLIASLQTIQEGFGQEVSNLIESPQLPSPEIVATMLLNQLVSNGSPLILVLDDYHVIANDYLHRTLEFMLENCPPLFHIVIISRLDPPLSLGKWRVRYLLTEIRIDDLRFSDQEVEAFFSHSMQLNLKTAHIVSLKTRTEGWIAGLQLAALSLRGREEQGIEEFINKFSGSHRFVIDYLFDEVFKLQTAEIKEFLCSTAILSRMCADLCDELIDRKDSNNILLNLEQKNLFLIPLDEERQWYRYHHLFGDFLRTELEGKQAAVLHQKASKWYEGNGYKAEAIEHSFAAGDVEKAVRLIKGQTSQSIIRGDLYTLIGWLDSLEDNFVRKDGELCSTKACAHFLLTQIEKANSYINDFKQIKHVDRLSLGRVKTLEAWLANICEHKTTIELAREAIELMANQDLGLKVFALVALAQSLRSRGRLDKSTDAFKEALKISEQFGYTLPICTVTMDLVYNYYIQGDLQQAIQLCLDTLAGKNTGNRPLPAAGILNIPLAVYYFESNQIKLAEESVLRGIEASRKLAMNNIFGGDGERTLSKIKYLQGCRENAFAIIQKAFNEAKSAGLPIITLRFEAILADFKLGAGEVQWVEDWIMRSGLSLEDEITSLKEQSYLVYVRFLMTKKLWQKAGALLEKMEDFSRKGLRKGRLVSILVLQAILNDASGNADDAKNRLREAVDIAAPQNYRRSFLQEGEHVLHMLPLVQDTAPEFVASLIENFHSELNFNHMVSKINTACGLVEPLSERELEVLRLVAAGLPNTDIASKLYISLGTVKWHANHIFAKLGVKNRTQAVNKAKELKII